MCMKSMPLPLDEVGKSNVYECPHCYKEMDYLVEYQDVIMRRNVELDKECSHLSVDFDKSKDNDREEVDLYEDSTTYNCPHCDEVIYHTGDEADKALENVSIDEDKINRHIYDRTKNLETKAKEQNSER